MDCLIHIGFHKTGTTALQRGFFPKIPGTFLTRSGPDGPTFYREISSNLCRAGDDAYDEDGARRFFKDVLSGQPEPLVISDEGLSGTIRWGGSNWARTAERLHRLMPTAKILVCIRHQGTMINSLYAHYVNQGGHVRLATFLADQAPGYTFDLDHLSYDRLVRRYQELFGPEQVKVLPYERLLTSREEFMGEISSFIGVAPDPDGFGLEIVNKSLSGPSRWVLRKSNRLFRRSPYNRRPPLGHHPWARDLRYRLQGIEARLASRRSGATHIPPLVQPLMRQYEESNAKLVELTGLALGELGYPLPGP
jgi:Sulfotransferase family